MCGGKIFIQNWGCTKQELRHRWNTAMMQEALDTLLFGDNCSRSPNFVHYSCDHSDGNYYRTISPWPLEVMQITHGDSCHLRTWNRRFFDRVFRLNWPDDQFLTIWSTLWRIRAVFPKFSERSLYIPLEFAILQMHFTFPHAEFISFLLL